MKVELQSLQRKTKLQEKALTQREKDLDTKAIQYGNSRAHIASLEAQVKQLQESNRLLNDRLANLDTHPTHRPDSWRGQTMGPDASREDRLSAVERSIQELRLGQLEAKVEALTQNHIPNRIPYGQHPWPPTYYGPQAAYTPTWSIPQGPNAYLYTGAPYRFNANQAYYTPRHQNHAMHGHPSHTTQADTTPGSHHPRESTGQNPTMLPTVNNGRDSPQNVRKGPTPGHNPNFGPENPQVARQDGVPSRLDGAHEVHQAHGEVHGDRANGRIGLTCLQNAQIDQQAIPSNHHPYTQRTPHRLPNNPPQRTAKGPAAEQTKTTSRHSRVLHNLDRHHEPARQEVDILRTDE